MQKQNMLYRDKVIKVKPNEELKEEQLNHK
jgi:hypothetical protein